MKRERVVKGGGGRNLYRYGRKILSLFLCVLLVVSLVVCFDNLSVEAKARDLVYVSMPIESIDGTDLQAKIMSNPSKYFVLQQNGINAFSENTLNASNWGSVLDTDYPSNLTTYFNKYFITDKDKLEFEIVDGGERICQHYAAYRVTGLGPLVSSGRWFSSARYYTNSDGGYRYKDCGLPAGGGYVEIPKADLIGYSGSGVIRFSIDRFSNNWNNGGDGWGDAWGIWTAQERAISYTSKSSTGLLNGAGSALCSYIEDNYNKYLPWLVGYPTDNGGTFSAYCAIGKIMFPSQQNSSGGWDLVPNYDTVKLGGNNINVSYTWGTEQHNETLKISGLGMNYNSCWWNVYNDPIGWYPQGDGYAAPDMSRQRAWTNPAAGGQGIHLNNAVARLIGDNACQYHTGTAHVDLDGAYYSGGSYNLAAPEWSHRVHFYSLKVYVRNDRTVDYNANRGSGSMDCQTVVIGTDIDIKQNGFTPPKGYYFLNWNTKADGTGIVYNPGDKYTLNENIVLYAQWRPITYQMQYDRGQTNN